MNQYKMTIPTIITLMRIGMTPFVVLSMIHQAWGLAFLLFCIAAVSDAVDGALARLLNERTTLGAILDPLADKCLLLSCFCTLAFVRSPLFTIPLWFVLIILVKECVLIVGAISLYCLQGSWEIKPTFLGKLTTLFQICFIIWLFACYFFRWIPIKTYHVMLGVLLTLTVITLFDYLYKGYQQLQKNKEQP